ncbi:hypothetical protein LTR66_007637 [Elasticomyces elasticus]|nr:hypothetical protein LTR28_006980 [Elasticomyces elasticus]KAK4987318.1 hypothetical protein LTR66_007637 [Elasticomyces elasticus]
MLPNTTHDGTAAVPIVDFTAFTTDTYHKDAQLSAQCAASASILAAFQSVGFVYLSNHGIARARVEECFSWSKKFFDLPYEKKMLAPHPPGGSHHRGYSGLGKEKVSQNVFDKDAISLLRKAPDVKESFESGNVNDEAQPNIWPPDEVLPGFREFMQSFFNDCAILVSKLLTSIALTLNLDPAYLSRAQSQQLYQLRLLHYPRLPTSVLRSGEKGRIGAHSDFGTLTLLFQDDVGGLEVEDPNEPEKFTAVTPVKDTVLVNVGDLLMRWSNDLLRSTVHRVVAPPSDRPNGDARGENGGEDESGEEEMTKARYSIPFFATADPDTVIEALPGTWGEERPKRYESMTAWEYVQMRMAALY